MVQRKHRVLSVTAEMKHAVWLLHALSVIAYPMQHRPRGGLDRLDGTNCKLDSSNYASLTAASTKA